MKIYGDLGSGNCLKVKYTADKLGLAYDWVPIDTMKGETRTPDFLARFPMARIPGVEFPDGRRLAEFECDHPLSGARYRSAAR